jgi:hypothetical protein
MPVYRQKKFTTTNPSDSTPVQPPHHRLGHHRGHYPQKSPGGIDRVATKEGAAHNTV